MASATLGLAAGVLLAEPIADALGLTDPWLVRAAFVGIWAQMNYEQLTAVFRVEERSGLFVLASLANIAVTVGATLLLIVVWDQGALGLIVGNFTRHADRLPRAARLPARPARPLVLARRCCGR